MSYYEQDITEKEVYHYMKRRDKMSKLPKIPTAYISHEHDMLNAHRTDLSNCYIEYFKWEKILSNLNYEIDRKSIINHKPTKRMKKEFLIGIAHIRHYLNHINWHEFNIHWILKEIEENENKLDKNKIKLTIDDNCGEILMMEELYREIQFTDIKNAHIISLDIKKLEEANEELKKELINA